MRKATWLVLLFLIALAAQGCTSQNQVAGPLLIAPLDTQRLGYMSRWITDLGVAGDESFHEAVVLDDLLVTIETPSNLVSAVSLRDGSLVWRRVVGERISTLYTPNRSKDKILINTENRMYVLSAATGDMVELSNLELPVNNGPAMTGSLAIFGADTGLIFAHSTVTGYSVWRKQLPSGILAKPVINNGSLFVADSAGNYAMYNTSGDLLWRGRTHARITATPALTPNGVFVPSEDESLYALNRATGKDRWIYRATGPLKRAPIIVSTSLFLPLPNGSLAALDPLNGSELWRYPGEAQPVAIIDQKLLLATPHSLVVIDNQSGKILTQVPSKPLWRVLRGPDNSLILISPDGQIERLDPK